MISSRLISQLITLVLFSIKAHAACRKGTQVNYYRDWDCQQFVYSGEGCTDECTGAEGGSALLVTRDPTLNLGTWQWSGCHYGFGAGEKYMCVRGNRILGIRATKVWQDPPKLDVAESVTGKHEGFNTTYFRASIPSEHQDSRRRLVYAPMTNSTGRWLGAFDLATGPSKYTGNLLDYQLIRIAALNSTGYEVVDEKHVLHVADNE